SNVAQFQYLVNKAEDNVRIFTVDSVGNITSPGYYPAGQLTLKISTDEQLQTVKEFTDKNGLVIVKRVMISGDSLQTYYLYDNLDMLRAVIQPEGTAVLQAASWVFPTGFSGKWMFLYRYDQRQRMVMKKVPGADSVNMLYDQWDRVVLTQDGNLRATHNFIFTKYDQLNRPVVTGQITDSRALTSVIADVAAATGRFETVNTSATEGYTLNGSFPSSGSYTLTVYTTTHYDSYNNLPSWSSGYSFVNEYSVAAQNTFVNGKVIATQVRILGTSNFNRTVNYYDDRYRVIQTTSDNADGGKDRITNILSFDGKVTNDYHSHTSRFFTTALVTKQVYTYDHMDRLLTITHQTGSQEVVTIAQNSYNELGQLLNKKIHQSTSHPNALQKLDYYYNIRGWLSGINRPIIAETGYDESDLFTMELHYPTVTMPQATGQYNGNIAEQIWKNGYDEGEQGYSYQYDQANRLTGSAYGFPWYNGTQTWVFTKRFDESSIAYDHNGNIQKLTRYFGDWNVIDSLAYGSYNGNQLGKVGDIAGPNLPVGFQDKVNGSGNDYTYDANGNLTSDYNKSITSITYNYLNLPQVVSITGKGTITYTYDAAGNKLQKTTLDQTVTPNKTTNYYYAGDYVYRNDTLEFISHPEGRLRPVRIDTTQAISMANLKYIYDYFLKDHLGSVRSVLTTEQQTDIYAATMESAAAAKEDALFTNVSATASGKPSGMTNDTHNLKASKLNGAINITGNKRVGPGIVLKVMTGDTISISTWSWYTGAVQPAATGVSDIATDLLPLLTAGVAGQNGGKGGVIPSAFSDPILSSSLSGFLSSGRPYTSSRPKAFLNWMVVGEDYTSAASSPNHVNAVQIPACNAGDTLKQVVGPANMVIRRNGWIYIYLSNESAQDVYFDNLVINLKHGPLVEQKDYYPFGLQIPGLSTKALKPNYTENWKKTYQGQEHDTTFGMDTYEFKYRMDDPEIGRFRSVDPLADKYPYNSTYAFSENKVTSHVELEGLEAQSITDDAWRELQSGFQHLANWFDNAISVFNKSSTSTVVASTPVSTTSVGTTVTTSVSTNFGESMSYVIANNSNQGNTAPLTTTTTTVTADTKTDIKTPVGTVTNKTTVSTTGVVTNEVGAKRNVVIEGVPATVGGSVSKSTSGQTTATAQGSTNSGSVQGVGQAQYSTNGKQQSASVGAGGQTTAGKTTTVTIFGIKFNW
ncbi:MAG: hypothetical protein Q8918_19430, partial [Bacteroidota bacterium]|nr:hypothetical protein [Bacteroidota bacterium]